MKKNLDDLTSKGLNWNFWGQGQKWRGFRNASFDFGVFAQNAFNPLGHNPSWRETLMIFLSILKNLKFGQRFPLENILFALFFSRFLLTISLLALFQKKIEQGFPYGKWLWKFFWVLFNKTYVAVFWLLFSHESDSRIANVRNSVCPSICPSVRPSVCPLPIAKNDLFNCIWYLIWAYQPSSLSTIEPIDLWSSFATFKPFGLFLSIWTSVLKSQQLH